MTNQMDNKEFQSRALSNRKSRAAHLKAFNKGIELFNQGAGQPIDDGPVKDGWLCAEAMREIRIKALADSQAKFNIA